MLLCVCHLLDQTDSSNSRSSIMSQVFVVVAAGSVLSFIIRELGEPAIASWVIQVCYFNISS